jgi:hypothetical protein
MLTTARPEPTAEDHAVFAGGARTVRQARAETGLSRQELFALMESGEVRWATKDMKNTRLLSWADLTRYLASLYAAKRCHSQTNNPSHR